MSPAAVAALTHLLHACLADTAMPSLQDIMRERQEKLDSPNPPNLDSASHASPAQTVPESSSAAAGATAGARQVEVRWYDARARTALKKVAEWTNVPWTKMAVFECLAAEQAQVSTEMHSLMSCYQTCFVALGEIFCSTFPRPSSHLPWSSGC